MTTVLVTIAVILGVLGALYLSFAIITAVLAFRQAKEFSKSFNAPLDQRGPRTKVGTNGWEGGA